MTLPPLRQSGRRRRARPTGPPRLLGLVLAAVTIAGCGPSDPVGDDDAAAGITDVAAERSAEDAASGTAITLALEATEIELGTPLVARLVLRRPLPPPGEPVAWPDVPDPAATLPEGWAVDISEPRRADEPDLDRAVRVTTWTIEPYLPGMYEILDMEIGTARLAPIEITVLSVLDASEAEGDATAATPADIRDVADAPSSPLDRRALLLAAAAVLVLLVLAVLLRAAGRRRGAGTEPISPAAPEPTRSATAHALALRRLDAVAAEGGAGRLDMTTRHELLALALRQYIEDRWGLRAPERTTEEFLRESREAGVFGLDDVLLLERFLARCDLVKFARHPADESSATEAHRTAVAFAERTGDPEVMVEVPASFWDAVVETWVRPAARGEPVGADVSPGPREPTST